jgi:hypothetical protein
MGRRQKVTGKGGETLRQWDLRTPGLEGSLLVS